MEFCDMAAVGRRAAEEPPSNVPVRDQSERWWCHSPRIEFRDITVAALNGVEQAY